LPHNKICPLKVRKLIDPIRNQNKFTMIIPRLEKEKRQGQQMWRKYKSHRESLSSHMLVRRKLKEPKEEILTIISAKPQ